MDLSSRMLEHSRRLNPDGRHHLGDMRTIRLDSVFDAVLIHDAISYMLTEETFGPHSSLPARIAAPVVCCSSPSIW